MPVTVREQPRSRRFTLDRKGASGEILYTAWRSDDESEIAEAVYAEAPAAVAGLALLAIDYDPQGGGVWFCAARYGILDGIAEPAVGGATSPPPPPGVPPPPPPPPQPTETSALADGWAFGTTGGTRHITQSYATLIMRAASGDAPDFAQAIGVGPDGTVAGVDVVTGKLDFSTSRVFRALSMGYINTLADLTGKLNDEQYWIYSTRELLFLGASGEYTGPDGWRVTFNFQVGPTQPATPVGNGIILGLGGDPAFTAHDYVWVRYTDGTDDNGNPVQIPLAAYVEQVYLTADFGLLGLGGEVIPP